MATRPSSLLALFPLMALTACSSERITSPHPVFSFSGPGPNGKIAFSSDFESQNKPRIYTMNPDGSDWVHLTDENLDVYGAGNPAWSPDGLKIAFAALPEAGSIYSKEIYVMAADGTGKTRLTVSEGLDYGPEWSPDGQKIAFISIRSGAQNVWVMNADGSNLIQLTTEGVGGRISWSPNGTKIAYNGGTTDGEVFVMDAADGGNKTNLTNSPGSADGDPAWSPDGTKIAFSSNRDGSSKIWIMNADGSNPFPVTTFGTVVAWSPDGTKLLFQQPPSGIQMINADGTNQTTLPVPGNGGYYVDPAWGVDPTPPPPPPQCSDGIDNDGDGKIDYPADKGCSSATDNDETNGGGPPPKVKQCNDGIDNDGDGLVDLADPQCRNKNDNDESR